MKHAWWRRLLIVIPLAAGAGVFYYFASNKEAPKQKPPSEQAHFSRVVVAEKLDVIPKALGYGTVKSARVWSVVARVGGEIEFVHPEFKKGAILKAGTELVRISPRDYELQIMQSRANIRLIEAKVSELKTKQKSTEQSLEIEMRALELKQRQLARKKELRQQGTIAEASLEAEENVVLLQQQKIQDIRNTLSLIPSQTNAQIEQKAVYESQLETAKLNLERIHIRLPFDARISDANVEVTQYVQTGKEMGSADNTEDVEVEAQIPLSQFKQFMGMLTRGKAPDRIDGKSLQSLVKKTDLHAVVRLPFSQGGAVWRGRLVRITDEIDPKTRTVGAVIAVDHPYQKIIPGKRPLLGKGMFVEVELRGDPLGRMMVVPRSALHEGGLYIVSDDNRLQLRPVKTAFLQGNIAVLAEGVKENERIVVSDLIYATDGMLMKTLVDERLAALVRREAVSEDAPR